MVQATYLLIFCSILAYPQVIKPWQWKIPQFRDFQSHVDDEDNSQPFPALLEEAMLTWRCLRKALVDNDRHEIEAAVRSSPNSNWT